MNTYDVQTLADAMGGRLAAGSGEVLIETGVSTDTRTIKPGSLFVALAGENFDAHAFLGQAVEAGASALVVSRVPEGFDPGPAAVVEVPGTLIALQRLACWYRSQLDVVVVGITGSNGKTSTKDFTAAVLGQRYRVHATKGNLNNHIGLPLTVLAADDDDEVLVLEMGMNHAGEIAPLCEIARPHIGIITNVGTAHIEFMGSREAIADEKSALARALPEVGTLLVTAGCDFAEYFHARTHARTIAVGNARGQVRAESLRASNDGSQFDLVIDGAGRSRVELTVAGKHMVNNALLAAGAGWALGLTPEELASGLESAKITGGRLRCFEREGVVVFDDTYNANPESMRAAMEVVADQTLENGHSRTVVLGKMAELGRFAEEMHHQVGEQAAKLGLRVVSVGEGAAGIAAGAREVGGEEARHFNDYDAAAAWLRDKLHAGDVVLFKGSRAAAVERIMNQVFSRERELMLYWLYEIWDEANKSGAEWAHSFRFLNLFYYITVRAGLATVISFLLIVLLGPRVIRKLISMKVGQPIRTAEEVHKLAELHGDKAGTPTMGGVLILGAVLVAVLICGRPFNPFVAVTSCVMLALGLLGFMDDYTKVVKKDSAGISARQKLFWQVVIAGTAACFLFFKPEVSGFGTSGQGFFMKVDNEAQQFPISEISFPLIKKPFLDITWLAIPFFVLIIVGCSNAVNLTDGLDGLATGCTITVSLAYAVLAYIAGNSIFGFDYLNIPFNPLLGELSILLMALVGAGLGFLWWNCHPAKVFMGDTGSLAIGGAIATAAICTKQELLLVIIGGVFVMEALSVILQVGSFKLRGKRIFAMSPIHHHFELRGWHESQVIIRFWILSIIFALFGLGLLKVL